MTTQILKVNPDCRGDDTGRELAKAAEIIKAGGLVAFPTETVYGLGADTFNTEAVEKIYQAKGRPPDNPLIVHIHEIDRLTDVAKHVPSPAKKLMDAFWPGPLTLILDKNKSVPLIITGGRETVAVRFPKAAVARELIRLAGVPIAAPSANISGRPSPTEATHVIQDFSGKIDMILDGGSVRYGLESTIADVTGANGHAVEILRPGSVTREMIAAVIGDVKSVYDLSEGGLEASPRAPGMKYRHYSPLAEAYLVTAESFSPEVMARKVNGLADEAFAGNEALVCGKIGILATDDTIDFYDANKYTVLTAGDRSRPETIASNLFKMLRRFDALPVERIYCEAYPEDGVGAAIMNRLKKACGGNVL